MSLQSRTPNQLGNLNDLDYRLLKRNESVELIKYPHPILTTKLPLIEHVTDEHWIIAEQMTAIQRKYGGVGLAANQVGYPFQMFVIGDRAFINPFIMMMSKAKTESEGCLSMPGIFQPKTRWTSIKLRYLNLNGETITERFTNLQARIVQHEVDHLNGILCLNPD